MIPSSNLHLARESLAMRASDLDALQHRRQDQLVASTSCCQVGRFRASPDSDLFLSESPPGHAVVAFPFRSVRIKHSRHTDGFVTDRALVVFHNEWASYRREVVDPLGDDCVWLWAEDGLLQEIVDRSRKAVASSQVLFDFACGPCSPGLFREHRKVWQILASSQRAAKVIDPLWFEETIVDILGQAISEAAEHSGIHRSENSLSTPSRFITLRAREYLASHFFEAPTLDQIADAVGCSKFHLCRVFKAHSGLSLHCTRSELQLRAAYDRIAEGCDRLSDIAADLGFSSHSHMTANFTQRFGVCPSAIRAGETP